ncbi:MAG: alanine:cation symporter family protein, partial [Ottowia sp.]|nr:alanine:cation symporter family protein [Ottowia sp.]
GALGDIGPVIITVAMVLFAFTTLLGNLYYCDNLLIYLNGKKRPDKDFMLGFRIVAALLIFIGAIISMGLAWDVADVLMGIMALINVPVIIIIGGRAIAALGDYARQRQAGQNPVFKAADIGLTDTECWK